MSANHPDRLSDAFALLASEAVAGMPPNLDLEERLMTGCAVARTAGGGAVGYSGGAYCC